MAIVHSLMILYLLTLCSEYYVIVHFVAMIIAIAPQSSYPKDMPANVAVFSLVAVTAVLALLLLLLTVILVIVCKKSNCAGG